MFFCAFPAFFAASPLAHGLRGDSSVGMDLLQHLEDVDSVEFLSATLVLLHILGDVFLCLSGLSLRILQLAS